MMQEKKQAGENRPIIDVGYKRHWGIRLLELAMVVAFDLLLWAFLLVSFYVYFVIGAYREQALFIVEVLFAAAALILLSMTLWQYYNWLLFHGKDRRKVFQRQTLEEVAALYGMKEADLEVLQSDFRRAEVFARDESFYYQPEGREPMRIGSLSDGQKRAAQTRKK